MRKRISRNKRDLHLIIKCKAKTEEQCEQFYSEFMSKLRKFRVKPSFEIDFVIEEGCRR